MFDYIPFLFIIVLHLSFILNIIMALDFISNIIMICIQNTNCLYLHSLTCSFLLHILLGMSAKIFITDTSIHGLKMVRVVIMTLCLVPFFCQYQFFFYFIILSYYALTAKSHILLTYPYVGFFLVVYVVQISTSPYNVPVFLDPLH